MNKKLSAVVVIAGGCTFSLFAQAHWTYTDQSIYINDDRSIGIGTSMPGGTNSKLDVANGNIAVGGQAALGSDGSDIYVGDLASGDGIRGLILRSGDLDRVFITREGNVGVGTIPENEKLEVAGKIKCNGVKINDWTIEAPDYVFEKGYKLPTIKDVEMHITNKKHLPGVPSASQMKKDGVDLSEMNMILLKKIEELTLYVIAQDKKIESLENKVSVR